MSAPDYGPYFCCNCRLDALSKEIIGLKESVSSLCSELQSIKCSSCSSVSNSNLTNSQSIQQELNGPTSNNSHSTLKSYCAAVSSNSTVPSMPSTSDPPSSIPLPSSSSFVRDRKFNVVLYGIPECSVGSTRAQRSAHDLELVTTAICNTDSSIPSSSIRDCHRLGKFSKGNSRHRPILVMLNRSAEVNSILSKKKHLPTSIYIKPDMNPDLRKLEKILLKERRALINSGVERKDIKMSLHTASIYVSNLLYGRIVSSTFQRQDGSIPVPATSSSALPVSTPNPPTYVPFNEPVSDSHHPSSVPSSVEADAQESVEGDSV